MNRCVHCLGFFDRIEADHLPPESWYPASTPANFSKPRIPACRACNARYGRIEDDFVTRLGRCLDPEAREVHGLPERALRAVDPAKAKSKRDRAHREARKGKLFRQTFFALDMPPSAFLPDLSPKLSMIDPKTWALAIPADSILAIGEKFVRGVTFLQQGLFVDHDHRIEVHVWSHEQSDEPRQLIERFGLELPCGPGFRVRKAMAHDDPVSGLFEIVLWGRLPIYASVEPVVCG